MTALFLAAAAGRAGFLRSAAALSVASQVNVVFGAAEVAERGRLAIDRPAQLQVIRSCPCGVSGKFARTSSTSRSSSIVPVPNVFTITETGSATPMA